MYTRQLAALVLRLGRPQVPTPVGTPSGSPEVKNHQESIFKLTKYPSGTTPAAQDSKNPKVQIVSFTKALEHVKKVILDSNLKTPLRTFF